MILKFELKDNTVDTFIPISPVLSQLGFIPKEESQMFSGKDLYTATGFFVAGNTAANYGNSVSGPTDYIGAFASEIPTILNVTFADVKFIDVQTNNFNAISASSQLGQFATDLYTVDDTGAKIVSLFQGLQALKIPANKFTTTLTDPEEIAANNNNATKENLGKYYIVISPKYVETKINSLSNREHEKKSVTDAYTLSPTTSAEGLTDFASITTGGYIGRRNMYFVDKAAFVGTPWNFDSSLTHRGQLMGSVVEVWNSGLTVLKQQKYIAENALNFDRAEDSALVLTPDIVGFDSSDRIPLQGDKLRIYPRETYFRPIYIEVDFVGKNNDILSLVEFMKNDVARNLISGVFEIYDNNGIVVDSQGGISGAVTQAYQISREGDFEVRRKLKL